MQTAKSLMCIDRDSGHGIEGVESRSALWPRQNQINSRDTLTLRQTHTHGRSNHKDNNGF